MLLEEFVERDAVHKALMSLLTQDVKGTLHVIFECMLCHAEVRI